MKHTLTILSVFLFLVLNGQAKYDNNWFLATHPHPDPNYGTTQISFFQDTFYAELMEIAPIDIDFTSASWSDENGEFRYYTNGCEIINSAFELLENGDSINPGVIFDGYCEWGYIVVQGALILPDPSDDSKQFIFHIWLGDLPVIGLVAQKLLYTHVDLNYNNGLGAVTEKNQPVILDTIAVGQMTAVKHGNGKDWWLIMPENSSNGYYKILLDENGPQVFDKQDIGTVQDFRDWGGQAVFSPDGSIYFRADGRSGIEVFDFDRCEGLLTNARHIDLPFEEGHLVGAAISPNSRYAYVSSAYELVQYDLWADQIAATADTVGIYDGFQSNLPSNFFIMQLAPDGKIYMTTGNGTNVLHVIHNPDEPSGACNFEQHAITLPTYYSFAPPNFPNYRLGPLGDGSCEPTAVDEPEKSEDCHLLGQVRPNPVQHSYFTMTYCLGRGQTATVSLFDPAGRLVQNQVLEGENDQHKIPVEGLSNGLYFYQVRSEGRAMFTGKVVVQR